MDSIVFRYSETNNGLPKDNPFRFRNNVVEVKRL
jgi:hypothetical protein